jgi:pimeloyl-ACP methyl ester carboxylesterase
MATDAGAGLRLTHFDANPAEGVPQSTHPMLFLHGAWDPPGAWADTAKHFATLGHETGASDCFCLAMS